MFRFQDGVLKKGAYVNINGVEYDVIMPEYQSGTPLSSENLNRALSDVNTKKATIRITENTAKGATIALPYYYWYGADEIDVYLNGERLILSSDVAGTNGHYTEVGEPKSTSNQIKLTNDWNLEKGDYLEIVVKGDWSNDTNL